mmetsp:Transcript_90026/g.131764  ORF Transcript_90026/g.131764 Transcript_90026/m.131764 type:complete len:93 (+) Transcript_90026:241-519(+)
MYIYCCHYISLERSAHEAARCTQHDSLSVSAPPPSSATQLSFRQSKTIVQFFIDMYPCHGTATKHGPVAGLCICVAKIKLPPDTQQKFQKAA